MIGLCTSLSGWYRYRTIISDSAATWPCKASESPAISISNSRRSVSKNIPPPNEPFSNMDPTAPLRRSSQQVLEDFSTWRKTGSCGKTVNRGGHSLDAAMAAVLLDNTSSLNEEIKRNTAGIFFLSPLSLVPGIERAASRHLEEKVMPRCMVGHLVSVLVCSVKVRRSAHWMLPRMCRALVCFGAHPVAKCHILWWNYTAKRATL